MLHHRGELVVLHKNFANFPQFDIHVSNFCFQLGGTIGDIEGMPFVEAFRQFQFRAKRDNFVSVHVSLVPQVGQTLIIQVWVPLQCVIFWNCLLDDSLQLGFLFCVHQPKSTGEHKTKPTQNSIRELRGLGLYPDMVGAR